MQVTLASGSPRRQLPSRLRAVGPGWHPLLLLLHDHLIAVDADYQVVDLKEELGAVRVHLATETDLLRPQMRTLAVAAEEQSVTTCEFCGSPGSRRRRGDAAHGWIKAVCDPCHTAWSHRTIMIANGAVHLRQLRLD